MLISLLGLSLFEIRSGNFAVTTSIRTCMFALFQQEISASVRNYDTRVLKLRIRRLIHHVKVDRVFSFNVIFNLINGAELVNHRRLLCKFVFSQYSTGTIRRLWDIRYCWSVEILAADRWHWILCQTSLLVVISISLVRVGRMRRNVFLLSQWLWYSLIRKKLLRCINQRWRRMLERILQSTHLQLLTWPLVILWLSQLLY